MRARFVCLPVVAALVSCAHAPQRAQPAESAQAERLAYWQAFKAEARKHLEVPEAIQASPPPGGLETVVRFLLDRDGRIVRWEIARSSGDARWDDAAGRMLAGMPALAPPPAVQEPIARHEWGTMVVHLAAGPPADGKARIEGVQQP